MDETSATMELIDVEDYNISEKAWNPSDADMSLIEVGGHLTLYMYTTDCDTSDDGCVELYDSEASHHVSPYDDEFVTYKCIMACPITMANNYVFHAVGIGDMIAQIPSHGMSKGALKRCFVCTAVPLHHYIDRLSG